MQCDQVVPLGHKNEVGENVAADKNNHHPFTDLRDTSRATCKRGRGPNVVLTMQHHQCRIWREREHQERDLDTPSNRVSNGLVTVKATSSERLHLCGSLTWRHGVTQIQKSEDALFGCADLELGEEPECYTGDDYEAQQHQWGKRSQAHALLIGAAAS